MKTLHVVAGIIWHNGKFLASCRPEGKARAGFWEFPGGKIEAGETPDNALRRELAEELDIRIASWSLWQEVTHEYPDTRVHLYFYHITAFDGTPRSVEGHGLAWQSPQEAQLLTFLEADVPVVEALLHCTVPTEYTKNTVK